MEQVEQHAGAEVEGHFEGMLRLSRAFGTPRPTLLRLLCTASPAISRDKAIAEVVNPYSQHSTALYKPVCARRLHCPVLRCETSGAGIVPSL